jgi:hypothetical protein
MKRSTIGSILSGAAAGLAALAIALPAHAGSLNWSGDVDARAKVTIHRHDVDYGGNKNGVNNEHHDLRGGIGPGAHHLRLQVHSGRGRVWIQQRPSAANDFTAIVGIDDPQHGAGHYEFVLTWEGRRDPH